MRGGKRGVGGVSKSHYTRLIAWVPLALPVPDWTSSGTRTGKASGTHIWLTLRESASGWSANSIPSLALRAGVSRAARAERLHFQAAAQADGMGFAVDFDFDVVVADAIYLALDLSDGEFFAFMDFQGFVGGAFV
jgi:hypothetical protein